ncbi:MAG: DUF2865 domain-containing protein [Hyphomicrobiaceae bacterium]|nr:DUF2865 domain-containing protein [Hyphomicrobiaceae bacterium]MCC0006958.1 DUF2865 domain-containing protein [Hyphomicrobiaceae bacterium]
MITARLAQVCTALLRGNVRVRMVAVLTLACLGAVAVAKFDPANAQGFSWPWENEERPRPAPREPVYRDQPRYAPPPADNRWGPEAANRNSVCLRLEQRLVQESQGGNKAREQLPEIERALQQARRDLRQQERELEQADCYEWFLFTKQLRNSRQCRRTVNLVDETKRLIAELEGKRQDIETTSGRSYQDEIIRELARNNCGPTYQNEARRRDRGPFSSLWQDEEGAGGSGNNNGFRSLPFATYRTVCVRLCDGYYFPVSFSTLPNHFQRDADVCQSKCAAPAELYFYQNPGGAVDQMVSFANNEQYTKLKTAFLYRKEYINGCSCKQTEYIPQTQMPAAKKADAGVPGGTVPQTTGSTGRAPQVGEALDPWRPR